MRVHNRQQRETRTHTHLWATDAVSLQRLSLRGNALSAAAGAALAVAIGTNSHLVHLDVRDNGSALAGLPRAVLRNPRLPLTELLMSGSPLPSRGISDIAALLSLRAVVSLAVSGAAAAAPAEIDSATALVETLQGSASLRALGINTVALPPALLPDALRGSGLRKLVYILDGQPDDATAAALTASVARLAVLEVLEVVIVGGTRAEADALQDRLRTAAPGGVAVSAVTHSRVTL